MPTLSELMGAAGGAAISKHAEVTQAVPSGSGSVKYTINLGQSFDIGKTQIFINGGCLVGGSPHNGLASAEHPAAWNTSSQIFVSLGRSANTMTYKIVAVEFIQ